MVLQWARGAVCLARSGRFGVAPRNVNVSEVVAKTTQDKKLMYEARLLSQQDFCELDIRRVVVGDYTLDNSHVANEVEWSLQRA